MKEFDHINEELQKHGFGDVSIGGVGLDRLRKTAQLLHISQHVPSLSAVIQFLEISSNQEYLVRRIRDLAKGGCMSDFKWNGGGNYNGKQWDYSLPTDSVVGSCFLLHIFWKFILEYASVFLRSPRVVWMCWVFEFLRKSYNLKEKGAQI